MDNLKASGIKTQNIGKATSSMYDLPKNMLFKGEQLVARDGLRHYDELIFDSEGTYNNYDKTVFTDCYYYKDDVKGRIFIIIDDDMMTNIIYHFYVMWSTGEVQGLGEIYFTRASATTFGMPQNFTLYRGKKTRGCGIYFLVRMGYGNELEDLVKIYELDEDMTTWNYIYYEDIYVPTLLAFGRGRGYATATELDSRIAFSKPIKLESANILTNQFYAYYTTDGYSAAFELPVKELGNEAISCVYTDIMQDHTFVIESGKNISEGVKIDSKTYYLGCNRETGIVYFIDEDTVSGMFPFMGSENNLKFSAYLKKNDDLRKLSAMSRSMSIPTGREGEGNQTVIFYGNKLLERGKICWINSENPLYFPKSCAATPGNISNELKGAYIHKNNLFVYDNENLYSGTIKTAGEFDLDIILKGVIPATAADYDKITFTKTTKLPQEIIPRTVVTLPDRVFFTGTDGEAYEQKGDIAPNFKKITDLSVNGFLPEYAVSYKGGYLLVNGKAAYYYDPQKECLFYWDFAAESIGGFSFSNDCILFAKCICREYRVLIYGLHFLGQRDGAIADYTSKINEFFTSIQAEVVCEFDLDDTYNKRLHAIILDANADKGNCMVYLFADNSWIYTKMISFKNNNCTLRYGVRFKKLKIKVNGSGLSFNNAKAVYYDGKTI